MHSVHANSKPVLVFLLAATTALAVAGWFSVAQATNARGVVASPSSVAVVKLVELLEGLDERTAMEADLDKIIAERQTQIDELNTQLETLQSDLEILRPGTAAYQDKARQLLEIRSLRETRFKVLQEIIAIEKGRMLREIYANVTDSVAEIAQRQGYDVVLVDDAEGDIPEGATERQVLGLISARRVLFAGTTLDITSQVRTYMNNAFQAGG
jgi:Skp family chaperone for outer membrane proteins